MNETQQAPLIYGKLLDIQEEIPAILKDREFTMNGKKVYNFRGIDDLYNAVNPLLKKHRVFMRSEILEKESTEKPSGQGKILFYEKIMVKYILTAEDGSCTETTTLGIGMDSGDKAANKAMSVAQKYALIQMFSIPTSDPKDPELQDHQVVQGDVLDLTEIQGKVNNCNSWQDLQDLYHLLGGDELPNNIRILFTQRKKEVTNG